MFQFYFSFILYVERPKTASTIVCRLFSQVSAVFEKAFGLPPGVHRDFQIAIYSIILSGIKTWIKHDSQQQILGFLIFNFEID